MTFRRFALSVATLLLIHSAAHAAPLVFSGKLDAPDFNQLNPAYPNGGSFYCVPTSDADGIVWLHNHGFSALPDASQEETIVTDLAALMGTDPYAGTSSLGNLQGMHDYLARYYDPSDIFEAYVSLTNLASSTLEDNWQLVEQYVTRNDTFVTLWGTAYSAGQAIGTHSILLAGYDMTDYDSSSTMEVSLRDPLTGPAESTDTYTFELWNISGSYYYATTEYPDFGMIPVDYAVLRGAYVFQITVPEPATLLVLAPGAVALLVGFKVRRRSHSRRRVLA